VRYRAISVIRRRVLKSDTFCANHCELIIFCEIITDCFRVVEQFWIDGKCCDGSTVSVNANARGPGKLKCVQQCLKCRVQLNS